MAFVPPPLMRRQRPLEIVRALLGCLLTLHIPWATAHPIDQVVANDAVLTVKPIGLIAINEVWQNPQRLVSCVCESHLAQRVSHGLLAGLRAGFGTVVVAHLSSPSADSS
jgi:hypothetical protein